MKLILFVCVILLTVFLPVSAKAQDWTLIDTSVTHTNAALNSAFFTDDTTGYVVGLSASGGVILKTTNAGASWTLQNVNYGLKSVYFPSRDTGYAVGYHCTIMKTINAGATWVYQNSVISPLFLAQSVVFINNNIGFVGVKNGPGYAFLKTYDGGASWINDITDTVHANNLFRINDTTIGGMYGKFSKTINSGASWTNYPIPPNTNISDFLFFINDTIGFATLDKANGSPCYNYSSLIKTTDGGQNWTEVNYDCDYVGALAFPGNNIGYMIGGNYKIWKTKNAGNTWDYSILPYTSTQIANNSGCYYMICTDTNTCYLLNNDGTIFKTTNGGGAVGIEEQAKINNDLIIYPNPATDQITIELSEACKENVIILIKNTIGQTIKTFQLQKGNKQLEIDVSDLSKGLYFVQLQSGDKMITKKFIKQ